MTNTGLLHRINIEQEKYYLYSSYSEDKHEFQIQLTDGIYSCQGKVPKDELEDLCNQVDMELEKYIKLLKEALGIIKEANRFSYVVSQNDQNVKFSWKQVLSNGMKFQLGSVTLQKDDKPNVASMLDVVAEQLEEMKSRCRNLEESRKLLESEYKTVTKRMESYTDTKKNIEQDLYSKFCVLLNSKKARIRELKEQVETKASSSTEKAPSNGREKRDTDTDTESDRDTDDERAPTEQHIDGADMLETSTPDIILDEQIADDDDRPRKNRRRIRSSRPKTPTNAKVPRTTSIPRPKRQNSTGSNNSQKERKASSEEMNADTLLDML